MPKEERSEMLIRMKELPKLTMDDLK
jgi:hypothetical protein